MLIGHQKQWQFFKKAAEAKRLSHAYLFVGQEQLGKKTLALELISFLFGQNVESLNNHPDLIFIEPKTKEIQISQIRDLIRKLSFKPNLARIKIALINDAHLMNQEAQTAFLKTLEEPKGETLLILISHRPQYLFPTILSRLQTVRFNSVKKEELKKGLLARDVSEKQSQEVSEIALGRPGRALNLILNKQEMESFYQKMKELNKISDAPLYLRFQYVKNLAENLEDIRSTLDVWLFYYRNALLKQPTGKIKNVINLIQTTKFLISSTNINPKLALERLVLEI